MSFQHAAVFHVQGLCATDSVTPTPFFNMLCIWLYGTTAQVTWFDVHLTGIPGGETTRLVCRRHSISDQLVGAAPHPDSDVHWRSQRKLAILNGHGYCNLSALSGNSSMCFL